MKGYPENNALPESAARKLRRKSYLVLLTVTLALAVIFALAAYPDFTDRPVLALFLGLLMPLVALALLLVMGFLGILKFQWDPAVAQYTEDLLQSSRLVRWTPVGVFLGLVLALTFPPWVEQLVPLNSSSLWNSAPWKWMGFHPVWEPPEPTARFSRVTRCGICLAVECAILAAVALALLLLGERRYLRLSGRTSPAHQCQERYRG